MDYWRKAVADLRETYETNPDHEADEIRQRDWDDFVAFIRKGRTSVWLWHVSNLLDGHTDPYYQASPEIAAFATAYGWPNVLRAIAQGMEADEKRRKELMDRR